MAATAPTFSYAEAAKGRSPSLKAEASTRPESSEAMPDLPPVQQSSEGIDESNKSDVGSKEATLHGSESLQTESSKAVEDEQQTSLPKEEPKSQPESGSIEAPGKLTTGVSQTGTVPAASKEVEGSATPNESSESGWDKVSQLSQNDGKESNKGEWDADDVKLSSWEHVSVPTGLKEAPPPAVNPWQKRAMDAQTKVKDSRSTSSSNVPSATETEQSQSKKSPELGLESTKVDSRQRAKSGIATPEDKSGPGGSKTSLRQNEGKPRKDDGGDGSETTKPSPAAPPPPPNDATMWPTPKLAEEEEKRKAQDRNERVDKDKEKEKTPSKPHGKEKWEKVPYVPTAVFNTPMPPARRGGRGGARGGRDGGRGGHSGAPGERAASGAGENAGASGTPFPDRTRGSMGPPRGGNTGSRPKRSASAGPPVSREPRKDGDSIPERREDTPQRNFTTNPRYFQNQDRRTSTSTQTDVGLGLRQGSPPRRSYPSSGADRESGPPSTFQDPSHPRNNFDRRNDAYNKNPDFPRDQGFVPLRQRGDSRSERGRGGYRGGRNGPANPNHHPHAGDGPNIGQQNQGYVPTKSQSYNEARQGPPSGASAYGPPRDSRHHRSGSRSHSIPNQPPYARYPSNASSVGLPQLTSLHTDVANMYGYQPPSQPAVMSAVAFHPYMEHMQIQGMVLMQMEYYFSVDNLCKDMFLRKHMDSQGFVFLHILTNFNRIKQLTPDIELIRWVCMRSQIIELVVGPDGVDRVRKAQDWQQWVLGMEERDPSVQNNGPAQAHTPHFQPHNAPEYAPAPMMNAPLSPRGSFSGGQRKPEPLVLNGNGSPTPITDTKLTQTPLSAAVPDFTPTVPQPSSAFPLADTTHDFDNSFSDEQVKSLVIVVRKPNAGGGSPRVTMPEQSPRGHSPSFKPLEPGQAEPKRSGSSDRTSPVIINGDRAADTNGQPNPPRTFSPLTLGTFPRPQATASMPVYWVKDKDAPTENLPHELTHESYLTFRSSALRQREATPRSQCHHDMDILYQFWSHFLVRNFNRRMYAEFQAFATEDAQARDSRVGLRNLINFYYEAILGARVIADGLARDFVELVKSENGRKERPAFDKLRAAWRNGAFNFKNRVKIDKIVDVDLKAELEK